MKKIDRTTLTVIRCAIPLCLSFLVVVAVVFVAVMHPSLGWFSLAPNLKVSGMCVAISAENCDILVDRPLEPEYDREKGETSIPLYSGVAQLKTLLESDGYDATTATSTASEPYLAFELVNRLVRWEMDDDLGTNVDTRYLMPGAYGTLSFYIRPYEGVDRVVKTFSISLVGYYAVETESGPEIRQTTLPSALELLNGHILFFTEEANDGEGDHEDYRYDGLVRGSFTYDTDEHELCDEEGKTDCYKVTLYWEWPLDYLDIYQNISTKYPAQLGEYVADKPEYFFAVNQSSSDVKELSEGYDDGDQRIGNHIQYVSVIIK